MKLTQLLTSLGAALACAGSASAVTIFTDDFSSYTTTTSAPFTTNYQVLGQALAIGTSGLGGSQSLLVPSDNTNDRTINFRTPINLVSGQSITISWYFQRSAGSNFGIPEIGFTDAVTTALNTNPGSSSLRLNGAGPTWQNRRNNSTVATGSSVSLVVGNWYQMNVTMAVLPGGQLDYSGTLFNSDNLGNLGSLVSSFDPVSIATPYADSEVFAGLRVQSDGVAQLDNLRISVVPEPSTYALLAGSLVLVGVLLRRR